MKIVSGRTGSPHVTSQQFRQMLEGILGQDSYILTSGENLKPELSSNNLLKIRSGMMCHHGCISCVEIGTYDEVTLTNGSHGMQRIDLVVNRYTRNAETEVEKCEWKVITGTAKASSPAVPTYTKGNLQEGDLVDECPVFEIHYNGINVTEVKSLLSVAGSLAELNGKLEKKVDATTLGFGVSETFTGQYLNSKPIYQKMISVGALPNNTTKSISTGITGADYIWVDMENSFAFNQGASYPIPYVDPKTVANSIGVRITNNGATVTVSTGTNWSTYSGGITLRYTKK
ncbi:hypothetical protein [Mediterraneibacter faecis]|jgi:hypothetical protein|uniref:hypothetical protein n=1 Tax=Mediterraneibacter faecis TaxID=592978 RepID=UPI002063EFC1|nr:hypothetical protein [Mediterraneibacter faecis]DAE76621.1 MAG TPA: hypothetical protein [Caudoviricetes sp.]DAZ52007.1 MAG TPA: hypothetical protein [Caudoviricetes sp.]